MAHTRAKLSFVTNKEVVDFVTAINSDGSTTKWMLENFDSSCRVDARSLLGVMYAATEWAGEIYLINRTDEETEFPSFIDKYRALV